jgi:hypothetical protein
MTEPNEVQTAPATDEEVIVDEIVEPEPDAPVEETAAEPAPEAAPAQAPQADTEEVKRWRDTATISKGQLSTAIRAMNALKAQGVLTDEAIEEAMVAQGLDPNAVRSVLNQEPAPANPLQAIAGRLVEVFDPRKPNEVKHTLDEAYGEDTTKYFGAFDWLIGADPAEREALAAVEPSKAASYAVRRGKEIYAEYEDLKGQGSVLSAYRTLKSAKPPSEERPVQRQERVPLTGASTPAAQPARRPGKSFYDEV